MTALKTSPSPQSGTKYRRLVFLLLAGGALTAGIFSAFFLMSLATLKGVEKLENYRPPVITKILDVRGELISEFYQERRKLIDYEALSPLLIKAFLAVEDRQFPYHYGIDLRRIVKAFYVNLMALRKEQGGSTITIQLSKLLFLHPRKTFERKLKELWYALQLERKYSKKEILTFYFNQINFGHGSYGVEAAANFFFNKTAYHLSAAEAALLAGLPKAPTSYSPIRHPARAMQRHQVVLNSLVAENYLSKQQAYLEYASFWRRFTKQVKNRQATFGDLAQNKAPYFTEYIRSRLEQQFQRHQLYSQGLRVHTTLNLTHQRLAQKHLRQAIAKQNKRARHRKKNFPTTQRQVALSELALLSQLFHLPQLISSKARAKSFFPQLMQSELQPALRTLSFLFGASLLPRLGYFDLTAFSDSSKESAAPSAEGALVAISPTTGRITALVGGSAFSYNNQFNRALQLKRQVGSTLKPFIYALALESNLITAATLLNDQPTAFGAYVPKNYGGNYRGPMLAREALVKSVNVLAVEVLSRVGIAPARTQLAALFRSFSAQDQAEKFPSDLTLALGSGGFSPLSLATAYAVLANEGRAVKPYAIRYITDHEGNLLKNYEAARAQSKPPRLLEARTAFITADIIKGVFRPGGTAYLPQLLSDFKASQVSYGKTGTTSNWKDAWFAGANPFLSAVVWLGYDDNTSLGKGRTGGVVAAPVWIQFMKEAIAASPLLAAELLQPPKQLPKGMLRKIICKSSGRLADPYCPPEERVYEYFKVENYPKVLSDHHLKEYDREAAFEKLLDSKKNGAAPAAQRPQGVLKQFKQLLEAENRESTETTEERKATTTLYDDASEETTQEEEAADDELDDESLSKLSSEGLEAEARLFQESRP